MNISMIIEEALESVAGKLPNGYPNLNNAYHMMLIKEELSKRIDPKLVSLVLEEKVDDEDMIKYKDKDGNSKEMKAGSAKTMDKEHPAKIEYDKLVSGDEKQDDKPKSKIPQTQKSSTTDKEKKAAEKKKRDMDKTRQTMKDKIKNQLRQVAWENDEDREKFEETINKLIDGEEVSDEELELVNKYAAIKDSDREVALYLANTKPGDFRQGVRVKLPLGNSKNAKEIKQKMVDSGAGLADPVSTAEKVKPKLSGKDATLGKITKGRKRIDKIKKDVDSEGVVQSVTIGGNKMRRQSVPDTDELIAEVLEYKKAGMSDEDAKHEAKKVQSAIARYNRLIDTYANADPAELESVDLVEGADVSSKEGRAKVAKEGPKVVVEALNEMIPEPRTEAEQSVLDRMEKLGDIQDPDEYEKEAMAILKEMGSIASIKKGAPDVAEAITLCCINKRDIPCVAPAGETVKVADLIMFPKSDFGKGASAREIASSGEVVVSLTTAGGLSVKKDGGAASGFEAKLGMTTFNNKETTERLTTILEHHNHSIATTKKGGELSQERINKAESELNDVEDWARQNGILTEDLKFADGRTSEQWANDSVADWQNKGTLPPDCPEGDNNTISGADPESGLECITAENKKLLIQGLNQYARGGLLAQEIHNNDLSFQDYHNANANTRSGVLEMSDGIECINDMKFSANPGFEMKKDKNGNFIMRPNAVYAGNLHKKCR